MLIPSFFPLNLFLLISQGVILDIQLSRGLIIVVEEVIIHELIECADTHCIHPVSIFHVSIIDKSIVEIVEPVVKVFAVFLLTASSFLIISLLAFFLFV